MKILIAGDPNSIWTKTYIENVLLNRGNDIYLLGEAKGTFDEYYQKNKVQIINYMHNNPKRHFWVLFYKYIWTIWQIRKLGEIDVFHIHFVSIYPLRILKLIRRKCKKAVATYWGSDLLRIDARENDRRKKYLTYLDCITVCTMYMKQVFQETYKGLNFRNLVVVDFGINTYKAIDEHERETNIVRRYDYSQKPVVNIMVGYNGKEEQQHIKVLEHLNMLPEEIRKRINIIVPLTYGLINQSYAEEIKKTIESGGYDGFSLLTNFMYPEEMAELYSKTDIMIHAQTTDALSGTVQELLYAGVLVLNPKWLIYHEMDEIGVYYVVYNDFEDLFDKLKVILENGCSVEYEYKIRRNKELLRSYSGWDALIPKWEKIYHF